MTGASRGIGRAVALRLARDGFAVACCARDSARIDAVADEIRAAGGRASAFVMDVTDPLAVSSGVVAIAASLGPPAVVVNDAGIAEAKRFADLTLDDWMRTFAVNVTGAFLVTRACLPAMLTAGWGRVVNVGSTASLQGFPQVAHYVASKHALLGMTRALAIEAASRGVTANCVCPGYVDTEMTERSVEAMAATTGRSRADVRRMLESASPQKRLITPEEVAASVSWLASDEARGVNGQAIAING